MSLFREIPSTAGFPLFAKDLLSLFKIKNSECCLEDDFKKYLGVSYAKVTYSGTAALYLILESLKDLSSKKTVIIPSYICPLVPLAIKRAGLSVEICDIRGEDFNFNPIELEELCAKNDDILAIMPTHLAGIPLDFDTIERVVKKYKIFIIEDCAQALGATYKDKKVGTLGDFSFFSLCRGKGLTIYEGGVIATNRKEYAQILDKKISFLVKDNFLSETLKIWELFGYWIFCRPRLFWFVSTLPQIFWNLSGNKLKAEAEYFTVDFPIHKVSKMRKSVGHTLFRRLDGEINKQREKALFYLDGLKEVKGIRVIKEAPGTRATYPYLTLIFKEPTMCDRALKLFKDAGLGISQIYSRAITDYDYLRQIIPYKDCPGVRFLAERAITLSTSTFLDKKDLDAVVNRIKKLTSAPNCNITKLAEKGLNKQ
jgi:dTDP-4-amino-4,6-dideoxygalactose transaminase